MRECKWQQKFERVVDAIEQFGGVASTQEVANCLEIDRSTAKRYLTKAMEVGWVFAGFDRTPGAKQSATAWMIEP